MDSFLPTRGGWRKGEVGRFLNSQSEEQAERCKHGYRDNLTTDVTNIGASFAAKWRGESREPGFGTKPGVPLAHRAAGASVARIWQESGANLRCSRQAAQLFKQDRSLGKAN